jgi:hypothetical protein
MPQNSKFDHLFGQLNHLDLPKKLKITLDYDILDISCLILLTLFAKINKCKIKNIFWSLAPTGISSPFHFIQGCHNQKYFFKRNIFKSNKCLMYTI